MKDGVQSKSKRDTFGFHTCFGLAKSKTYKCKWVCLESRVLRVYKLHTPATASVKVSRSDQKQRIAKQLFAMT